jgi:hypothetical protein
MEAQTVENFHSQDKIVVVTGGGSGMILDLNLLDWRKLTV